MRSRSPWLETARGIFFAVRRRAVAPLGSATVAGMSAVPSLMRIGLHFDGRVTTVLCQLPHGGLLSERLRAAPDAPLAERCQAALVAALRLATSSGWQEPQQLEVTYASAATTQALLYRQLPRVVLLATEGFTDVLRIGRQAEPAALRRDGVPADPLQGLPADLPDERSDELLALWSEPGCLPVPERLAPDGAILKPLAPEALAALHDKARSLKADAYAVVLLHSPRNGQHEQQVALALAELGLPCALSSAVLPGAFEFERASAAVLSAAAAVAQSAESRALHDALPHPGRVRQVQGDGSARRDPPPLHGLLSDVASGLVGAHKAAATFAVPRCLTLGVGRLVSAAAHLDGALELTRGARLAGLPLGVPVVAAALRAVGAETWLHRTGSGQPLQRAAVAPQAAAARLWDAAAIAEQTWVPPHHAAELELPQARHRLTELGAQLGLSVQAAAAAVLATVTAQLVDAVWAVSVQRGIDPSELPLLGYGPAAGVVAAEVAAQLGISTVLMPPAAGCLAAYGALSAPVLRERACYLGLEASGAQQRGMVEAVLRTLTEELRDDLLGEGQLEGTPLMGLHWSADLRYAGQAHCLTLTGIGEGGPAQDATTDMVVRFHQEHERRYGFTIGERPVEIELIRVRAGLPIFVPGFGQLYHLAQSAESRLPAAELPDGVLRYSALALTVPVAGPVVIYEESAPLFVPAGWTAQRDKQGAIWLRRPPPPPVASPPADLPPGEPAR